MLNFSGTRTNQNGPGCGKFKTLPQYASTWSILVHFMRYNLIRSKVVDVFNFCQSMSITCAWPEMCMRASEITGSAGKVSCRNSSRYTRLGSPLVTTDPLSANYIALQNQPDCQRPIYSVWRGTPGPASPLPTSTASSSMRGKAPRPVKPNRLRERRMAQNMSCRGQGWGGMEKEGEGRRLVLEHTGQGRILQDRAGDERRGQGITDKGR